jgi:hypothetical protein
MIFRRLLVRRIRFAIAASALLAVPAVAPGPGPTIYVRRNVYSPSAPVAA